VNGQIFNLQEYVRNKFDGILVFGDVHGDYASFMRAYEYAKSEHLFFLSLGDLVDRGPNPFETVKAMYDIMSDDRGGFVIGNHDDKFYRFAKGAKVSFSVDSKNTLAAVGEDRQQEFLDMYVKLIDMPHLSSLFHKFDDITLVHAACHRAMWDSEPKIGKTERSRFLVGQTNGDKYPDGYPVRLYDWIKDVPIGKTVIVGHDKQPIHNIPIDEPMVMTNPAGGKTVFLDTGCGKGGTLSAAVIMVEKKKFKITNFMNFAQKT
jgi:hypothetical protein